MATSAIDDRTFGRFNQCGAVCGEQIPADDFYFTAFQLGHIDEACLRRFLALETKPVGLQEYWQVAINIEKSRPHVC